MFICSYKVKSLYKIIYYFAAVFSVKAFNFSSCIRSMIFPFSELSLMRRNLISDFAVP